jgi:haloalkane dehalogenase
VKVLRTPDECFEGIEDYPYQPNYTHITAEDGTELRIHHIDEGPEDGFPILCMHGQPVWSYLYRRMIPLLIKEGMRVIAPDLVGYGKSDKPAAREDYSYQRQVDWMGAWLAANNFSGLTFFGQDWGGLIGLRMVADQPDRFDRVMISNTGLPYFPDISEDVVQQVKNFRANAPTPTLAEMAQAQQNIPEQMATNFAYWQKFCWETEDVPVGFMLSASVGSTAVGPAYEAPFPDPGYKMGVRAMPSMVPTLPDDPSLEAQARAWAFYETFDKPFLCAFADNDPVTRGMDKDFVEKVPGAKGQPHTTIPGGGHFIQENRPAEVVKAMVDFIRSTR